MRRKAPAGTTSANAEIGRRPLGASFSGRLDFSIGAMFQIPLPNLSSEYIRILHMLLLNEGQGRLIVLLNEARPVSSELKGISGVALHEKADLLDSK